MWAAAEDLYRRALELDPDNPEALHVSSATLATVGRLKESLRIRENLRGLEPFVPIYNSLTANVMLLNGQVAASIATLEPLPPDYNNRNVTLARAYAAEGQYAKAADTLLLVRTIFPRESVADAVGFLRSAPTKVTAPQELPDLAAELNFVYSHVGALERVMEYPERVVKIGNMSSGVYMLWDPLYAPLRKTERFKTLMRDAGLVDYWRERGWPDLCRPVGADDFVCD
jgi:tetratricopeptide (TPR) repeat protein